MPLTRNPSNSTRILNSSSSSSTSSTTTNNSIKKKAHGLRISSVPTASSSVTTVNPSTMTRKKSTPSPAPVTPATTSTTPTPPPPPIQAPTPTPAPAPVPVSAPTPTPPAVEEKISQETNQLYEMLEKVQRERDSFQLQMKSKETAWERLVSSKESLVLQVQDKESANQRLGRDVETLTGRVETLEQDLAERDATIAKFQRDEEKSSQDQRRIERLDNLVRELQAQLKSASEDQVHKNREYQGAMDQVRKEVTASEALNAALEKECQDLRFAGLEAIHAYEESVLQITAKHEAELEEKNQHVARLDYIIADLKHKQSTLFDDDELDIETRLKELSQPTLNQTHRLEEQLELTMTELDSERKTIQTMAHELDGLKLELNASRQQVISTEQKYQALQLDFEKELADKKKLIEEADNAFERQAKAEDEHYQLKLSTMALEKEYNELVESNKQLESEYSKLMDDMMVLEKQDALPDGGSREKFQALEKEKDSLVKSLAEKTTQVKQLYKDLAELETLVENRVFGESELEEELELERKKVISLSRELNEVKTNRTSFKNMLISPTTTTTSSASPTPQHDDLSKYCEICERYGHDILQCKNTAAKMVSFIDTHYAYINNLTNYFF